MLKQPPPKYDRKVIKISVLQSPNVIYGTREEQLGLLPSDKVIVQGVISYSEYKRRLRVYDKQRQTVCLYGEFFEDGEILLFPKEWLQRSHIIASKLPPWRRYQIVRKGQSEDVVNPRCGPVYLGIDPGAGGDDTCWCAGDELGIVKLESRKTPDTSEIIPQTLAIMREFDIPAENVVFDGGSGGGGKVHADNMRKQGYQVRTIGFGEKVGTLAEQMTEEEADDLQEQKYEYTNRRTQLYGEASKLFDPTPILNDDCNTYSEPKGYGIPAEYTELIRQLSLIPRLLNEEGRLYIPSKSKRSTNDKKPSLKDILGCSPDEADAFVLMVSIMQTPKVQPAFIIGSART